jgi:hypothetical protein
MHRRLWLGGVLGAWLAAVAGYFLLGDDAPSPPPASEAKSVPALGEPGSMGPSALPPAFDAPPPSKDTAEPSSAPAALVPASTRVDPVPLEEPPPPAADNPFETENSREIDYAFFLVFGPDSGVETARAAVDVFQRCLEANPHNRRCYDGLVAAQQRQQPGWAPSGPPQFLAPSTPPPRVRPPPAAVQPLGPVSPGSRMPRARSP